MTHTKRTRRLEFFPVLVIVLVLAATGYGASLAPGTIKVGYPEALTGFLAPFEVSLANATKLAVEQINAAGGIGGKVKIDLQIRDIKSDASLAVTVSQELIDQGAQALIVVCNTDFQVAIASVGERNKIPVISPCNADPSIGLRYSVYWPVGMGGNAQAAAAADAIKRDGHKNVYILNAPDFLYVNSLVQFFKAAAKTRGLNVVREDIFKVGTTDFAAQVTKVKNARPKPDAIFTPMFPPDVGIFLKQLRAAGVAAPLVGTDGMDTPLVIKIAGKAAEGTKFTTFGFPDPSSPTAAFYDQYKTKYGNRPENSLSALGFTAVKVLETAVLKAQSTRPADILAAFSKGLAARGPLGQVTYKPGQRNPEVPVTVVAVKNGRFVLVSRGVPRDVPPPVLPK